jgi:DNA repair exonuclease SbcCD ATPase subunit
VELVTIVQIAFAAAAAVAALTLLSVAFDRIRRRVLVALAVLAGVTAVASWVVFGLRPETGIAAAAGGITVAFLAQIAAVKLHDLLRASRRVDDQLARAQGRINSLIAREAEERHAELERTLVRARADSASILAEQERRMAEERRAAAAELSRVAADELGEALTAAQQQMEVRLTGWTDDLERAQRGVADQLAQLAQRQKQLISEAEARIAADAERLEGESEQHRARLVLLRDELARAKHELSQIHS